MDSPGTGPKTGSAQAEWRRLLVAGLSLCAFLWLLRELGRFSQPSHPLFAHPQFVLHAALVVGAALAAGAAPLRPWRPWILLGGSVALMGLVLGAGAILVVAYALAICGLARLRGRTGLRVLGALLLWVSAFWLPGSTLHAIPLLILVWAQFAYASIYLIIEHARGTRTGSLGADLFYLLAFPRLLTPFFQPISPSYLWKQDQRVPQYATILRALGLGLWGASWAAFAFYFGPKVAPLPVPLRWGLGLLVFYGHVASSIFMAVTFLRLVGFDVHSGYRTPWLSTSFAEFFRRFNSYVRDAVVSLFYLPALGWLRTRLPKLWAKIVASYVAIIVGSFLLNDILIPAATTGSLRGLSSWAEPRRLCVMFVFWSAIILPRVGLVSLAKPTAPANRWRHVLRIVVFDLMWLAIWILGSRRVWQAG